ncbi:MAG TPA: GNAT family N-acetyltransferase [Polyangiaceae bacterium]|jgi:hypothetical protein|nr:GNAT family N-acetyltransferase [Polyangiaceae bacterium]
MASRPLDAQRQPIALSEISDLARCHRLCLPETASSRAGVDVLEGLYGALLADSAAHVVWHPSAETPHHQGAFAAGTLHYRATEAQIRRSLRPMLFARLALRAASMPMHVLARRRWENVIPNTGIGYVLTLGSASAVVASSLAPRGRVVLAELEEWFVEHGCLASWVDTELSNQRAHAFYLRTGYVEVSRDFGQVLLQKQLGPPLANQSL